MTLYNVSITFTYRDGSEFTESNLKPLNVGQLARRVQDARNRVARESNIVKATRKVEVLDNPSEV